MNHIAILISLLFLSSVQASSLSDWQKCPFLMYSYGLLNGSGIIAKIPDLGSCIANASNISSNVEAAIAQFQLKTANSIGMGSIILGKTIGDLIDGCGSTYIESKNELAELKRNFTNETFLIAGFQRLFDNISDVLQYLDSSKWDMDNGNYYDSGYDAGKVLRLFLEANNPSLSLGGNNLATAYPFYDCSMGEQMMRIQHVYLDFDQQKNLKVRIQGQALRDLDIDSVNVWDEQMPRIRKFGDDPIPSALYQLDQKSFGVGESFLEEFGGLALGNGAHKLRMILTDRYHVELTCVSVSVKI